MTIFRGEGKRRHAVRHRERAGNREIGWGCLREVPLPVWRPGCIATHFHLFGKCVAMGQDIRMCLQVTRLRGSMVAMSPKVLEHFNYL